MDDQERYAFDGGARDDNRLEEIAERQDELAAAEQLGDEFTAKRLRSMIHNLTTPVLRDERTGEALDW